VVAYRPEHEHGIRGVDKEAPRHQKHAGQEAAAPAVGMVVTRLRVTVVGVRAAGRHGVWRPRASRAWQATPAMPPTASGSSAWFTEAAW